MSKYSRDLESLRQNDTDLKAQYQELLYLRAQVARLRFPMKAPPPRKGGSARSNRSSAQAAQRIEQPAFRKSILLVMPGRQT